jgi:DNA topoisomerase I
MVQSTINVRVRHTVTAVVTVEKVFNISTQVCHSCDRVPGIRRERTTGGFRYRRPNGQIIRRRSTLARIKAIVIPPAWEDVWICANAKGHIQATGRDARGRKQYRYHPAFRSRQDSEKFERLAAFGMALTRVRNRVKADLALPGLPKEKVLAAVVRLLDRTHLRIGNTEYEKSNKSFGLSTLRDRHVAFEGEILRVSFPGKSGVWHDRKVNDRRLARVVRACRDLPGQHLFQFRDENGKKHKVGSVDVNEYIRKSASGYFTAKDFRTWAGTVAALGRLTNLPTPGSRKGVDKVVVGVIQEVAAELGNTPAVCRKSYIHPKVLHAFADGSLRHCRSREGLSAEECSVLALLNKSRAARPCSHK